MATQPTRTDDCVASSSCLPVVVGKRVATSWLACKETYRLAVEAYRRTVLILLADGENAGTFIDSLWNKFVARAPVFVGWASCFVCPSSEVRAASWRSLPPWKTFSPFSLSDHEIKKKKEWERGFFIVWEVRRRRLFTLGYSCGLFVWDYWEVDCTLISNAVHFFFLFKFSNCQFLLQWWPNWNGVPSVYFSHWY